MQTHETVTSFRKATPGSSRKFGLTFAALFLVLGLWPLLHAGGSLRWFWLAASALLAGVAGMAPARLAPLNRAWFRLGLVMGRVVNPIVMGVLFFGAVVPFAWYLRWRGKDLLRRALDPEAASYWIEREPPGPAPGTLTKQY